jgi:hypothetical protein
MKKALITGVTGQDGSYLAEFLLDKGYDVHGIIRRSSVDYRERIAHLEGHKNFHLHYGDMGDSMSLLQVIGKIRPDEIYNLAAQSHVQVSFDAPEFTADVDATGVLRVLEAVRQCGLTETCRIYQQLDIGILFLQKGGIVRKCLLLTQIQHHRPHRQAAGFCQCLEGILPAGNYPNFVHGYILGKLQDKFLAHTGTGSGYNGNLHSFTS